MLNKFTSPIDHISLPDKFPSPFEGESHELCIVAANEVSEHLKQQAAWQKEIDGGKMFGVLVVKDSHGKLGYLAAFSGNLDGKNTHPFFVPPVADILSPESFFKKGEAEISDINLRIKMMEDVLEVHAAIQYLDETKKAAAEEVRQAKEAMKTKKALRDKVRQEQAPEAMLQMLIRESQHEKAALKRLEKMWKEEVATKQHHLDNLLDPINCLKDKRKRLSAELQLRLFDEFQLLNINGTAKGLRELFADTPQQVPPAGAGECAGPKLLQFAFKNGLQPVAMAEFWWGASPKTEIRHHGSYYPACKGKCEPILKHMLEGMNVKHFEHRCSIASSLEIVFEDEWLIAINKPAGMLSVPGKISSKSAIDHVKELRSELADLLPVHRLDMATSGLLLISKTKEMHKAMQQLFKSRNIKKRYISILNGTLQCDKGTISLPICLNPLDRPRQMVSYEHGKTAITHFEVLERINQQTRIAFYPHTGRTHQLRVHAAHADGLNSPIAGDELYGKKSDRLYLHAEQLEFIHPETKMFTAITAKADF